MSGDLTQTSGIRPGAWRWCLLVLLCLLLDQVSKAWVVAFSGGLPMLVEVLPFLNLVMAWNRGVSFGLFGDLGLGPWPFLVMALLFSAVLGVWMLRASHWLLACALALMTGGALGNAIDRVRWGAVADFVDVHVLGWHFWAFNLADTWISVGAALLVADSLFRRES